jgi:hypothetical protein
MLQVLKHYFNSMSFRVLWVSIFFLYRGILVGLAIQYTLANEPNIYIYHQVLLAIIRYAKCYKSIQLYLARM